MPLLLMTCIHLKRRIEAIRSNGLSLFVQGFNQDFNFLLIEHHVFNVF